MAQVALHGQLVSIVTQVQSAHGLVRQKKLYLPLHQTKFVHLK